MSASFPIRDPQSGAYSRAFFDEIVDREVERSKRHGSVLSILSIVLANWAEFSASMAPAALEGAVHTLANTLQANLRLTDYLFRWEEDEFLALLVEANLDGCKVKVARLAATFRPWREGKGPLPAAPQGAGRRRRARPGPRVSGGPPHVPPGGPRHVRRDARGQGLRSIPMPDASV